ncbi:hypothetical protein [Alkalicoccus urumqiensis]|uniref:Uncharacterized protein n=1 Tax=Alkalicoccus urumqiensis TaxID=1548213 RepID=A0A2P6MHM9_ALKUR|nr:hypothetical protein [Alkalicoccus urumqiensis]PRO65802.1 hypothetical protein C6I21_07850 [Alkalicoccus urumqiensis]
MRMDVEDAADEPFLGLTRTDFTNPVLDEETGYYVNSVHDEGDGRYRVVVYAEAPFEEPTDDAAPLTIDVKNTTISTTWGFVRP